MLHLFVDIYLSCIPRVVFLCLVCSCPFHGGGRAWACECRDGARLVAGGYDTIQQLAAGVEQRLYIRDCEFWKGYVRDIVTGGCAVLCDGGVIDPWDDPDLHSAVDEGCVAHLVEWLICEAAGHKVDNADYLSAAL